MTDEERQKLCARLRTEGTGTYQAADEIERLVAENNAQKELLHTMTNDLMDQADKIERLAAEVEHWKLQASRATISGITTTPYQKDLG